MTDPSAAASSSPSVVREVLSDFASVKCLSGISIGLVVSLMVIIIQVSFAAMIFSGPLEVHAQRGMGLTMAGALALLLVSALFSSFRPTINIPQDAPVAIFAGAAAGIAMTLGSGHTETAFITVVAALMLSSMATAVFFLLAGVMRFAGYIRFMPYPVVAGFLAGTGWLLTKGSLEVMTGFSMTWATAPALLSTETLMLWAPGAAYALLLFFCLRRWSHFLILPGSMVAGLILYHLAMPVFDLDMEQARESGLFFASFASTHLWPVFSLSDYQIIQWNALLPQLPTLAVIPFIALLGLLLNTGGIELAAQRDLDLNRELLVNSGGNALAALAGSSAGYSALSLSMLGYKTGADTRIVGLTAMAVVIATLVFGGQIISIFPKALLGGFLLLLGLFFLSDWILDTYKRMPRADYMIVVGVFATIGIFGYLYGVLLGLLATVTLFVAKLSRIPAVESASTSAQTRSRKARPLPHQRLLAEHGRSAYIFDLNGFLFFGSVNALTSAVMEAWTNEETRFILVDFQKVTGFDISAVNNFVRLAQRISTRNENFILSAPPGLFVDLFNQVAGPETASKVRVFPDKNTALEWIEDQLLNSALSTLAKATPDSRISHDRLFDEVADDLLDQLEQQEHVETLLDRIRPYLEARSFAAGQELLAENAPAPGMFFIHQGAVRESVSASSGSSSTLRTLGQGTFFAVPAAYEPWKSCCSYQAESAVETFLLTPEALRELESVDPRTAQEIHRLVVSSLVRA
ncbi:SulP family inorganic anion transporter [Desulfonatronum parangueonense]